MTSKQKRYNPVSSRVNFPQLEESILEHWRDADVFRQVDTVRGEAPLFVFYEGPPTANGSPGIHHVLSRSFKDVILRYKTMQGFRPLRRGGWDTHGLPVELEVEKELGLSSKQEIEQFGIEEFNRRCRESVFRYVSEWEAMTRRAGVWLDMDNAYVTYHNSYIESAWWVFKRLWDMGLVYEDYKVTPHCPRCVTSLSSHEVALGYEEDTPDPSVYVRFPASEAQNAAAPEPQNTDIRASAETLAKLGYDGAAWTAPRPAFIAWTTTPWTLTANVALAVGPGEEYVLAESDETGERAIVALTLMGAVLNGPWTEIARFSGESLVGVRYDPPYVSPELSGHVHRVLTAPYVTTDDGTGIVHTAVAYGAEDAELGKAHGFQTVHTVDSRGVLMEGFPGSGKFVKEADADLLRDLGKRGLLFRDSSPYLHTYPFCWRCGTPLLYYAKASWYIRTTAKKNEMLEANRTINWVPDHIQEGRFGEWLRNNVDWAVSRERYWGTPIPIWRCVDDPEHVQPVGSLAEIEARVTDETRRLLDGLDLHRPFIDRVELRCAECGGVMRRVPEVVDAWYDSGAMPFAQWAYPTVVKGPAGQDITLEGVEDLVASPLFPANYITEAVDQTRGWFYSLLALSTLITGKPSYENCLVLGLILDGDGEKMSKSKGNVVNPWEVMEQHGADALRWCLFTAGPAAEARRFSHTLVQETLRQFLFTLWNTYSFFVTYANIDGFDADACAHYWKNGRVGEPSLTAPPPNELDRWIISELNDLVGQVAHDLDAFNPTGAGRRIQDFVSLLSNWYVRRSRRRFWKPALSQAGGPEQSGDDDKTWAYVTLYSCLLTLSKLMAPLTPFVADAVFRNLAPDGARDSVHLEDFPQADPSLIDDWLDRAIRLAMRIASLGRGARSKSKVKVRQPLGRVLVRPRPDERDLLPIIESQVLDELNVKTLELAEDHQIVEIKIKPNLPVLGPKLGPRMGAARAAIDGADPVGVASALRADGAVAIGGLTFDAEDLLVEMEDKPGVAAAAEGSASGLLVGVDTTLTPELEAEGLARELVHRVQNMRKAAGFDIEDRILTYVPDAGSRLADVLRTHAAYFEQETLSRPVRPDSPPPGAYVEEQDIEGEKLTIGVVRAG